MIFSVSHHSAHKTKADEIRCPYNQLGLIFDLIKDNPEKRCNIQVSGDIPETQLDKFFEQVNFVKEVSENYTIECGYIKVLHTLLYQGYNAYLKFPTSDWETFSQLKELGVSDIYIDGPLGFQMNKIKAGKDDTLIRVSPTISPNASLVAQRDVKSFFIRPEDLELYKDAIDVIDFHETNQEREDALFNIYKRGNFNFELKELVKTLTSEVSNVFIPSDFAKARLNCGQRCLDPSKPRCHLCQTHLALTNALFKSLDEGLLEKPDK